MKRLILLFLAVAVTTPADAQFGRRGYDSAPLPNTEYGDEFTFVRIEYTPMYYRGGEAPWHHDYPRAEQNLAKIIDAVSYLQTYMGGSNILRTDDPEFLRYPIAYLSEPGYWAMRDSEVLGLRNYLLRGGFLIVDDFGDEWGSREWDNFEMQMRLVLPGAQAIPIDASHPIFDSFFRITEPEFHSSYRGYAQFYGIYEDNDPEKRLMVIANYNADIGEYWEYSDTGFLPIDLSNEAYKLGVNYLMYAIMH
ncbi:MAG: DUF4159 domain-containing protein [Gemmatimonadetes bacterium]|nr:DUF4159 domain-containing protein [Gemmatimonadota bacterium]